MTCCEVHAGVQRCGEASQHGDCGLGAALFNALDVIGGHPRPLGEIGDAQAKGDSLVVQGLCRRPGPRRIAIRTGVVGLNPRALRADVLASHHTRLSQV